MFRFSKNATKTRQNLPIDLNFTKQSSNQLGYLSQISCGILRKPGLIEQINSRFTAYAEIGHACKCDLQFIVSRIVPDTDLKGVHI